MNIAAAASSLPAVEAVKESVHAEDAAALFVKMVNAALPSKALDELRDCKPHRVEKWAAIWHVNAPCVREAARALVTFARYYPKDAAGMGLEFTYRSSVPRSWLKKLAELDGLPVATAAEPDCECGAAITAPVDKQARRPDEQAERRRMYALAPISVDPLRESLAQWTARARRHWERRQQIALSQQTFSAVSPRRLMPRDVRWCVRFQMGMTATDIALSEVPPVEPAAVYQAVRRVAVLLNLTLRPSPRVGRRRKLT
jgi:hypothetical protein